MLLAQLSCYNWEGKEARALSRERTGRHGCTGREPPPTTPEFQQVRTSNGPNPTVKLVRKCMCRRGSKEQRASKRALSQPVTSSSGGNFQTGSWRRRSRAREDSTKKGGQGGPPRCSHTVMGPTLYRRPPAGPPKEQTPSRSPCT